MTLTNTNTSTQSSFLREHEANTSLEIEAIYTDSSVPEYRGNPLIEALPDFPAWEVKNIIKKISKEPENLYINRNRIAKNGWLNSIPSNFFNTTKRHYALFEIVDLLIRRGYALRSPMSADRTQYLKEVYRRQQAGEQVTDVTFEEQPHDLLTASLIGTSGMGKTCTVKRILSMYPRLIRHQPSKQFTEILQITSIHVECPHDGSVVSLCRDIIDYIIMHTGIDYREVFKISDRTTLNTLKSALVHIIAIHYVGILVIDEIQNLVSSRKNRDDLFNFVVSLSNSVNVPLLFVGTPRLSKLLNSNLRTSRRFGTRGFITWAPLKYQDKEWESFMKKLWQYNILKEDQAQMPEEIQACLFHLSAGIIEIIVKLFILAQIRVILVTLSPSAKNNSIKQILTTDALEFIYNEYFSNVRPIIEQIQTGDVDAIMKLDDIVLPDSVENLLGQIIASTSNYEEIDDALFDV